MVVKKHKKKILFALLFLIIFSISFIFTHNNDKITKLLKTKDYNYLPEKAKQYIKEQYEKSGYIILTEKNKQENMPYLNPHYVAYLNASAEERAEKYNVVPSAVILDYVSGGEKNNKTYPETFDLRNVDGVNYTTPNRNQSTSSLCAFFATTGTLESNLLYQSRTAYSNSALKFSERQMDYATSSGGIIEYPQSKGRALLTEGANFEELARVAKNGLGFINLNKHPFDLSKNQKEISDILNFENSEYELNEAINFPFLDTATANESDINSYVNMIKDYVITYGGVYVATGSPQGGCAYYDSSINNYLIYDTNETREDDACILNYHAMEIIGWDDNFSYEFCKDTTTKTHSTNMASCPEENKVIGTGAWILKNSWGSTAPNPYLAYNSRNSAINAILDVTKTSERNWDKYYLDSEPVEADNGNSLIYTIHKDSDFREQLDKIKIEVSWMRYFNLDVYYSPTGNAEDNILIDSRETIDSSIYTLDLKSQNIEITDGATITLKTTTENGNTFAFYMTSYGEVTAYVQTMDEGYYLNTIEEDASKTSNDEGYSFRVNTYTQNIDSGEEINYELYDENNKKIDDSHITFSSNKVGPNLALSKIELDNLLPEGEYKLKSSYKDDYSMSVLNLGSNDSETNYVYVKFNPNKIEADITYKKYALDSNDNLPGDIFNITEYDFLEWNTKDDGTGETISNVSELGIDRSESIELYAIYDNEKYTIIFNSNNPNNEEIEQYVDINTDTQLINNPFTYENYNFIKWTTESDGTGTEFVNQEYVNNLAEINKSITLYANWERQTYTIVYNSNNGEDLEKTQNVNMGDEIQLLTNEYINENYNFMGWSTNPDGSGTIYKDEQTVKNLTTDKSTITLYAIWTLDIISSQDYEIKDDYIKKINDQTEIEDFKNKITYDSDYTIKIYKNGTELEDGAYISTGSITRIYYEDQMVDEYYNVVVGDINGSGTITISDVAKVFSHIMNYNEISEDYNLKAADVNGSTTITISDVSKMYSYIMGFIGGLL